MSPLADRAERSPRPPILGHIRLGVYADGRPQPTDTFVFTSPEARFLEPLAREYGGTIQPYIPQGSSEDRYRLVSGADSIVVLLPFGSWDENLVQAYELHGRGGIKRRCDGITCVLHEVDEETGEVSKAEIPCLCADLEKRECSTVSRLRVWMPQTGLGVWQCQTTSKTASYSVVDEMQLLDATFGEQQNRVPVRLSLRDREIPYVDPKDGKRKTTKKRIIHVTLATPLTQALDVVDSEKPLVAAVRAALGTDQKHALPAATADSANPLPDGGDPEEPPERVEPAHAQARSGGTLSSWAEYQQSLERACELSGLSQSSLRQAVLNQMCKDNKWGLPPKESWPDEQLDALTAALDRHIASMEQAQMEVGS